MDKNENDILYRINEDAALYYHEFLNGQFGQKCRNFLVDREHFTDSTINHFEIGYAGDECNLYSFLKDHGYSKTQIEQSKLIRLDNTEAYKNRVVFPIKDEFGRCVGFSGRLIEREKAPTWIIFRSVVFDENCFYGIDRVKESDSDYILICEGVLDAIMAHQTGFDMTVSIIRPALSAEHVLRLKEYGKKVMLCFNSDEVGKRATNKALEDLKNAGIVGSLMDCSPYRDFWEFIIESGEEKIADCLRTLRNN